MESIYLYIEEAQYRDKWKELTEIIQEAEEASMSGDTEARLQ